MRPHLWIRETRQIPVLWLLFGLIVIVAGVLSRFTPPGGWLLLEFPAWTNPMPDQWLQREREATIFGLGVDFLFLAVYPLFLSLLLGRAATHWNLPDWLCKVSGMLAGAVLIAAPLDALENAGLYLMIAGDKSEGLRLFVTTVAAPKWFLAIAASFVALLGITMCAWRKRMSDAA